MAKQVRDEPGAVQAMALAIRLHNEGVPIADIAKRLETYARVVRFWVGADETGHDYNSIRALRNRGQTNTEIAAQLGVPREYVWHTLGTQKRRPDTVVRQIRVNRTTWERIPEIANTLGVRKLSENAKPSNSAARLLDAIAAGHVEVSWKPGTTPDTVNIGIE